MTYQTDAYHYMNLLACYVWAVQVTNKKRLHNLKWLTKLTRISRWIYLLVTMPKLISDVNFFFFKGTRARTSIGLLQRRQCIQIHQEADGPSLLAISQDRTDVRSIECTDPSTAPLDLVNYMKRQWIESPVFTPQDWSVYKQPICTDNDIFQKWIISHTSHQRHRRLA